MRETPMFDLFWIALSMTVGSCCFLALIATLLVLDDRRTSRVHARKWANINAQHKRRDVFTGVPAQPRS